MFDELLSRANELPDLTGLSKDTLAYLAGWVGFLLAFVLYKAGRFTLVRTARGVSALRAARRERKARPPSEMAQLILTAMDPGNDAEWEHSGTYYAFRNKQPRLCAYTKSGDVYFGTDLITLPNRRERKLLRRKAKELTARLEAARAAKAEAAALAQLRGNVLSADDKPKAEVPKPLCTAEFLAAAQRALGDRWGAFVKFETPAEDPRPLPAAPAAAEVKVEAAEPAERYFVYRMNVNGWVPVAEYDHVPTRELNAKAHGTGNFRVVRGDARPEDAAPAGRWTVYVPS